MALQELKAFDSQAQAKKNIVRAIESVAKKLGNTKAVCRKCYIHPSVLGAVADEKLLKLFSGRPAVGGGGPAWERFLVRFIKTCERRRAG
jgi:DNA topoisomerase IB